MEQIGDFTNNIMLKNSSRKGVDRSENTTNIEREIEMDGADYSLLFKMLSNTRRQEIIFSFLQRFFQDYSSQVHSTLLLYLMPILHREKYRFQDKFC